MSEDATISPGPAEAEADAPLPGEGVVTIYTHNGEEWVPERLEAGENTVVRLADGQPVAVVEADEETAEE